MDRNKKSHKSKAEQAAKSVVLKTGGEIPPPPSFLTAHGKACYQKTVDDLKEMGVADAADFRAVEAFAAAYEEWRKAREFVLKNGFTYKTFDKNGELRFIKRPEVAIMEDAWKRCRSLLPQLYFTPVSRMKGKSSENAPEKDPFAEFLTGTN